MSPFQILRVTFRWWPILPVLGCLTACRADPALGPDGRANRDWTEASHGNGTAPKYDVVFPQAAVNTLEIQMTAAQWTAIRANMRSIFGYDFGAGGTPGLPPGGGAGGLPAEISRPEPDYVDVTLTFNGKRWTRVGFRLKGNSSLTGAWRAGNYKLPFRLHFDRFEDQYPEVANQRLYGFRELSMSPGYNDQSLIREKLATDVFRAAGIPSARTAFTRVFIDFGSGRRYVGVYTMVEVIDDTMVETQFGDATGNVYKPVANLRTFQAPLFEKKNNATLADYRDVQALITALNDPVRTTDAATWRSRLEATIDMPHVIRWLAVNTALVNWDTYGAIAHNYYLYNHPTRRLVWIPWDLNEAMNGAPGITGAVGGGGAMPGPNRGMSLSLNEATATSWPLIRFIADDPVYLARYRAALREFVTTVFTPEVMGPMIDRYSALVAPHAVGPNGEQPGATFLTGAGAGFNAAPATLKAHVQARRALVLGWVPQ
jgi:spore coat protein CotH